MNRIRKYSLPEKYRTAKNISSVAIVTPYLRGRPVTGFMVAYGGKKLLSPDTRQIKRIKSELKNMFGVAISAFILSCTR